MNADTKAPKAENLLKLARATGVSYTWLVDGKGEMLPQGVSDPGTGYSAANVLPGPPSARFVPEIAWVQAGAWTEAGDIALDLSEAPHWPCPIPCSDRTYVLRVVGESMVPEYMPGTLIFVDPERFPESGKDVIAVMTDTGEATFKRYIEEPGSGRMLKALNPAWNEPYVRINGNCQVIGVVIAEMRLR
ncbi:hypothetical protein HIO72_00605 [Halomonas sp. PA5]|nr:hypothetical protein HIO72_00605 [Halomonas sp. PA5]